MAATAIIRRPEIIRQGEEILELERAALEADRGISPTGRRVLLVLAIVIDVIQLVFSALLSMLAVIPGIGLIILGLEVYA